MADSYRSKPRKIMAKRRREADPGFRTRVIERKPNHGDGYPLNKKMINKIIDIIPDEYLFGLKSIELKARGERDFGRPLATYFNLEKRIEIYSMPFDEILINDFSPTWKEVMESWSMKSLSKYCGVLGYYCSSDYAQSASFYCVVLFHEIGHHYSYNFKTRKRAADNEDGTESQAEIFGARIMNEVIDELKHIIPSPIIY